MKHYYHNEASRTVRSESIEYSTEGKGQKVRYRFSRSRIDVSADEGRRGGGPEISQAYGLGDSQEKAQELYELHHGTNGKEGWVKIDVDDYKRLSKEYGDAYDAAQKEKR